MVELQIAEHFASNRTTELTQFMLGVTAFGSGMWPVLVFLLAVLFFLIYTKRFAAILMIGISLGFGELLSQVLKYLIARPRPPGALSVYREFGFAMPSSHAIIAAGFYGMLFYQLGSLIVPRTGRWVVYLFGVIFVLLLSFSRIYLGVHWVSDVLVGFGLGCLINWALIKTQRLLLYKGKRAGTARKTLARFLR